MDGMVAVNMMTGMHGKNVFVIHCDDEKLAAYQGARNDFHTIHGFGIDDLAIDVTEASFGKRAASFPEDFITSLSQTDNGKNYERYFFNIYTVRGSKLDGISIIAFGSNKTRRCRAMAVGLVLESLKLEPSKSKLISKSRYDCFRRVKLHKRLISAMVETIDENLDYDVVSRPPTDAEPAATYGGNHSQIWPQNIAFPNWSWSNGRWERNKRWDDGNSIRKRGYRFEEANPPKRVKPDKFHVKWQVWCESEWLDLSQEESSWIEAAFVSGDTSVTYRIANNGIEGWYEMNLITYKQERYATYPSAIHESDETLRNSLRIITQRDVRRVERKP